MKKLYLSVFALYCIHISYAQPNQGNAVAKSLISKNSAALGLSEADVENSIVTNSYTLPGKESFRMIYLQQSYQGVPVYNEVLVLAFQNENLVSRSGTRVSDIGKKLNAAGIAPAVTMQDAVRQALADSKLSAPSLVEPLLLREDGRSFDFGRLGVAAENITAELVWFPIRGLKQHFRLAWKVFLAPANSSDYWLTFIDALNKSVIGKQNLTVSCNWDIHSGNRAGNLSKHDGIRLAESKNEIKESQLDQKGHFLVNSANYRCIPYPAESPTHLGAPSAIVANPWLMSPGNATTLGWHNDGFNDHDSTRGNNVWAAEDRSATNTVINRAAVSSTPGPDLTFNNVPDYTVAPTSTSPPNQQFGITNLFYWNNIMHDISYLYGFDEASGNFQNNNLGRGGIGNDYVIADAQDGNGSNNANFATPPDGTRPRMQMYLWPSPNPDRDGDLDNGIIAHEYAHGISTRLTGGPANSSCLDNLEQAGEGWSDYFALMMTTNWATATVNDGAIPRGIGTYVAGQPITGSGFRNYRYSTDLAINPLVYSLILPSFSHDLGEYWCVALWEMTWELVKEAGINPNLFNPAAGGGNSIALKLVIAGMRLQPCSPGFIDARDAILKADTLFFGAQYSCAIWRAFAKRGMGRTASQGSSESVTDQVPSFLTEDGNIAISQNLQQVEEGFNVTYQTRVVADDCSGLNNAYITDTLPANVSYVSGGSSYDPSSRTITFGPLNLAASQSQDFSFTVNVNNGSYFSPVEHFNESVPSASIPAGWATNSSSSTMWIVSATQSKSPSFSFFAPNPDSLTDHRLSTTASYTLNASASSYTLLSFWHRFNTEDGWDGGVVEISTDDGNNWMDLGSKMIQNGYNRSIGSGSGNVLGGSKAFTGFVNSFIKTVIDLSSFAGQSIKIRFRFSTDDNTAPPNGGWFVDDVVLYTEPAVRIKSNLFNSSNTILSIADTITRILPSTVCVPVSIASQPVEISGCSGNDAVFSVVAGGSAPISYQWQVNTGSGFTDLSNIVPYNGVDSASLVVTNLSTSMNGYLYRCIVTNSCGTSQSDSAILNVSPTADILLQPANSSICVNGNTSFSVVATDVSGYQWQADAGNGFADIANSAVYAGVTTPTLNLTNVTSSMDNYRFRCVLASCGPGLNSDTAVLTVGTAASISAGPGDLTVCQGNNALFTITASGSITGYQWQISTDGGTSFSNIAGETNSGLNVQAVSLSQSGNRYQVLLTGNCGNANSNAGTLFVNPNPDFTIGTLPAALCLTDSAITLAATLPGGTWMGDGVQNNLFKPSIAGAGVAVISYSLTNNEGCTAIQSSGIRIDECSERHLALDNAGSLLIYPNPCNGQFGIRVRTDLYTKLSMKVYASDGRLVATKELTGLLYDQLLPVNLSGLPDGIYHLLISNNEAGKLIQMTSSLVIIR